MDHKIDNKAQTFSTDLIISLALFTIALGVILSTWTSTMDRVHSSGAIYELEWMSTSVMDQLMQTPGVPKDWHKDPSTVTVIGLTEIDPFLADTLGHEVVLDGVIDPDKLLVFLKLVKENYTEVKNKLFGTSYEFYVGVSCSNETHTDCFDGMHVDDVTGGVDCDNGVKFNISGNSATISGGTMCMVGNYVPVEDMTLGVANHWEGVLSEVFEEDLDPGDEGSQPSNRTIRSTLVLWISG